MQLHVSGKCKHWLKFVARLLCQMAMSEGFIKQVLKSHAEYIKTVYLHYSFSSSNRNMPKANPLPINVHSKHYKCYE